MKSENESKDEMMMTAIKELRLELEKKNYSKDRIEKELNKYSTEWY